MAQIKAQLQSIESGPSAADVNNVPLQLNVHDTLPDSFHLLHNESKWILDAFGAELSEIINVSG